MKSIISGELMPELPECFVCMRFWRSSRHVLKGVGNALFHYHAWLAGRYTKMARNFLCATWTLKCSEFCIIAQLPLLKAILSVTWSWPHRFPRQWHLVCLASSVLLFTPDTNLLPSLINFNFFFPFHHFFDLATSSSLAFPAYACFIL